MLGLAVGLAVLYLAVCFLLAYKYVYPVRFEEGDLPHWATETTIPGSNYDIPVWLGEERGAPVYILVHGYGGSRGDWTTLGELLAKNGTVIVPATTGQTVSPGKAVGFAVAEAEEIIACARWAKQEYGKDTPVVVVGISMGGAASWLAAANEPDLFSAVVSEGAFSQLDTATDDFLSSRIRGGSNVFRPVKTFGHWISKCDPKTVRPIDAAKKWAGRPALVIHGGNDELFPPVHAEALSQAAGCELWIVKGARHAGVSQIAADEMAERIVNLVEWS